jgi:hypothetical protein
LKAQDRIVPGTGIESDQDEAGQVAIDPRPVAHATLIPPKGARQQSRRFLSSQVALARFCLRGKGDRDRPINFALLPTPPKCGAQDYKFAASR